MSSVGFSSQLIELQATTTDQEVINLKPSLPIKQAIFDNSIPSKSNRVDWVSLLVSGLAAFGQLFCKMFTGFFEAYGNALGHHKSGLIHGRASRY